MRYAKSGPITPVNRVIFHLAQSGEVLVPFSPLPASETTEKTRRAGILHFPVSGNIP
uniref:Uncharacterized protein n=1 Tax=Leclercia adecarboxylata TaxID=83655 RepID=A0A7G5F638_9ENTR|nr:hypothetical protein [Leclercia adecarboxylata]